VARYRIVPEHSILWAEARSSLHPIKVETAGLEGFVDAAPGTTAGNPLSGHLELASARVKTGNILYDRELERRLEVARYPLIQGDVTGSRGEGGQRYHLRGDLSFHGVTRTLEGEVTLREADSTTVEIEGATVIDVRDFALQPPRLLMLRVYPEIRVRIRVLARC